MIYFFFYLVDAADDDIEKGKGVDEELSLLPDAERELSEADKERAIHAQEDKTTVVDDEEEETAEETATKANDKNSSMF